MVLWERPAGLAGGNGGCAGRVMYDGRHEPDDYEHWAQSAHIIVAQDELCSRHPRW